MKDSSTHRYEENKMLEASVEMSFFLESHNLRKVRTIDVCIYPKQPFANPLHKILEVWREWFS